ncbi:MAG: hypothetical protein U0136_16350 [Bdellovibrionota bacterium]
MRTNLLVCVGSPDIGLETCMVVGLTPEEFAARRNSFQPRLGDLPAEPRFPANAAWSDFLGQLAAQGVTIEIVGSSEVDHSGRTSNGETFDRTTVHCHVGTCDPVLPLTPSGARGAGGAYQDVNLELCRA